MLFSPQIAGRSRVFIGGGGGGGGGAGTTASAFLARTSGLDSTHINAYTTFLNGLDTDSLTAKFDVLHIYATQDSTTALLNLVSTSYNGVANGTPTFTADSGFTGVDSSTTVYIQTNFNPSTASSPKYVRNSAHLSAWSLANSNSGVSGGCIIGYQDGSTQSNIFPKYNDGKMYFRQTGSGIAGTTNADGRGHFISNRPSSGTVEGYKNATSVLSTSDTSIGLANLNILTLAANNNGFGATGFGGQVAMASIGSSLSSTDATNFYNRLRTYMTAVGVP